MAANTSNTSQAVENLIAANPQQGLTAVEQAQNIVNPGSVASQPSSTPAGTNMSQFGPNNPNAANWGPALTLNQGLTAGLPAGEIPSIIYYNSPPTRTGGPIIPQGLPNPEYVAKIPPSPTPETPITQSAVTSEVDKIIEASREVVDEINTNTPPEAPVVETQQDTVTYTATPITPTELVLAAQASCESTGQNPEINIEIVNKIDFTSNVSASAIAFATASANMDDFKLIRGCMDPDATNYDPTAVLPDGSCEYAPLDPVKGCTNPNALNYDPLATEDDGSCQLEPVLPPIPPMSQFLDSHGQLIFEVPKELVEKEGTVDMPKGSSVQLTATRDLVNPDAKNPIVRPAPSEKDIESDLILTPEEASVATRKQIRKQLTSPAFPKLASDIDEEDEGTKDIIIRKPPADTKIVRNERGAILITTNTPVVKASLQSQAFVYEDYRKAIDTSFSELVGKM